MEKDSRSTPGSKVRDSSLSEGLAYYAFCCQKVLRFQALKKRPSVVMGFYASAPRQFTPADVSAQHSASASEQKSPARPLPLAFRSAINSGWSARL
eukprot:1015121-Amphidinium_carterae.1